MVMTYEGDFRICAARRGNVLADDASSGELIEMAMLRRCTWVF
jgi:hypothetical protein